MSRKFRLFYWPSAREYFFLFQFYFRAGIRRLVRLHCRRGSSLELKLALITVYSFRASWIINNLKSIHRFLGLKLRFQHDGCQFPFHDEISSIKSFNWKTLSSCDKGNRLMNCLKKQFASVRRVESDENPFDERRSLWTNFNESSALAERTSQLPN